MDLNLIRILVTLAAMAAFLVVVVWAYAPSRRERLDAEARRILKEIDE
jgi:cbb3-type cytochrome oxidase subunit 3